MFDIALLLGPVAFRDFEVPATINFGGAQRLAIHRLAGGTRVIDSLGRDDANITFSGTFTGTDATLRARLIDELRASGLPLPLTWDVFFYTIVISAFQADYQNGTWIPYRLTCTVLRDEASALIAGIVSLATDVASDVSTAFGLAAASGVDLTPAQTALSASGATVRGTSAYVAAQSALGGGQATLGQAIASAEAVIGGIGTAVTGDLTAELAAVAGATTASQTLASLTAANSYLGRSAVNLANAGT